MTNADRQKRYRDRTREELHAMNVVDNVTRNVTRVTDSEGVTVGGALRYPCRLDYHLNPQDYIPRREPDRLNWGPWMDSQQLEHAGLKANRVPIPGDWDYEGVAA